MKPPQREEIHAELRRRGHDVKYQDHAFMIDDVTIPLHYDVMAGRWFVASLWSTSSSRVVIPKRSFNRGKRGFNVGKICDHVEKWHSRYLHPDATALNPRRD